MGKERNVDRSENNSKRENGSISFMISEQNTKKQK